jgi:flagellar protein FliL
MGPADLGPGIPLLKPMAAAKPNGNRDVMMTMVIALLLTLIGAGVGFAVGAMLVESGEAQTSAGTADTGTGKKPAQPEGAEGDGEVASGEKAGEEQVSEDLSVIPIPPVLTTLSEPKGKWIRLEGSILLDAKAEKQPELLAEEAGEQILTYLRTVRLGQLDSASGILGLRDDLDETVMTLSGGQVRGVLIHGLVVE